jgi:ADP-dependent NAD(P)H-hydrate dehydratase / NAD(P)H-hydrate epimerase
MSHTLLQDALFNTQTVRELDRLAVKNSGMPSFDLMQKAGAVAFAELLETFGKPSFLHVFCGTGNNGGDGYIIAALAAVQNIPVTIYEVGNTAAISGDANLAKKLCIEANVNLQGLKLDCDLSQGVIVDSLMGTGFKGSLRGEFAEAIEVINCSFLPVMSIDIPSGLSADTGAVEDIAVKADLTVTFIGAKQGLFTGRGPAVSGEIVYDSLDIPESILQKMAPSAELMDLSDLLEYLPEPEADVHKSQRGHCMIIGGELGFGGAAIMAAEACLTTGSGLTSLVTRAEHITASLARQPEIMACAVASGQQLEPLLDGPTVLVIGPGLGRSSWSEQLLQKALASDLPMVVDADGLNIISEGRVVTNLQNINWIMTPHPGEAARLLDVSVAEIEADRFSAVRRLQEKYKAIVILKGAGSLVSAKDGQPIKVCPYGNPGMSTGGMGDILSGVIGSLIAQGIDLQTAAELGCCLHSAAADMAVQEKGYKGLVATDILPYLAKAMNQWDQELL